jgi:hypothetical protein
MPPYPRSELEEMMRRWLELNQQCEAQLDWRPMAEMFTEDATYGWNVGPSDEFMAVGRAEIRELALRSEMEGLGGWTYPYQRVLIDEVQGEILGLWRQVADAARPDGTPYEVAGLGGSWFRYGGDFKWSWQRDFFDVGNVTATYLEMARAGALTDAMQQRLTTAAAGQRQPGHYRLGQAPVGLWEGVAPEG